MSGSTGFDGADWGDFRGRWLPILMFSGVLAVVVGLWDASSPYSEIVGMGEAVSGNVHAGQDGVLTTLEVGLLAEVKRGDVIARIVPADAEALRAGFAASLEELRAQLAQTTERNLINYQELRLEWLQRQSDVAGARIELEQSVVELERYTRLHAARLVSDSEFETVRARRDSLAVRVATLDRLVADLQAQIGSLQRLGSPSSDDPGARAVAAAIFALEKQTEAQTAASVVRAPMDGIVTYLLKRAGENVRAGEPLLTLGSLRPERIVAYQRQPLGPRLAPGDRVVITSRSAARITAEARVLQVGTQLELIDATLLPTNAQASLERGLPLLVELPAGFSLQPGEILTLSRAGR